MCTPLSPVVMLTVFLWMSAGLAQESGLLPEGAQAGQPEAMVEADPAPEVVEETIEIDPFAALLTQRRPSAVRLSSRQPQLYETTQGEETFIFQALGAEALIRFRCDPQDETLECDLLAGAPAEEVMLLQATRSPRGDVIYKDQEGEPVLRVTSNGGATLFTPDHNVRPQMVGGVPFGGKAVLPVVGSADPLTAPLVPYSEVEQRMRLASDLIYERHGMLITFIAAGARTRDHAVLADAVLMAAKGIDMVADDELGARVLAERLNLIQFVPAQAAGLALVEGRLTVEYNVNTGLEGRPSSLMIARYLENAL